MGRTKTISDAELLEAARQVFVEQGIRAPVKTIARRAGVSEGVLFQRFATKEELFFAAMMPPPLDVNQLLHHPRLKGRELLEKVVFAMLGYFRETLPVLVPLMSHPKFQFEEFASKHPDSPLNRLRWELVDFVIRQQNEGHFGKSDPRTAALVMWSTAQTIAFFEQLGAHGGRFQEEMIQSAVMTLWDGMAPKKLE